MPIAGVQYQFQIDKRVRRSENRSSGLFELEQRMLSQKLLTQSLRCIECVPNLSDRNPIEKIRLMPGLSLCMRVRMAGRVDLIFTVIVAL